MQRSENRLTVLVRSVLEPMGYELVGVEFFQRGKQGSVLRVYIDHMDRVRDGQAGSITLDDCGAVSNQLSGVLDVEDPIGGPYDLEVSSPGLDRPLFTSEHFERFRGRNVRVKSAAALEGRRNLEGRILGVKREPESVLLEVDGERREVPLTVIDSARLVPEF